MLVVRFVNWPLWHNYRQKGCVVMNDPIQFRLLNDCILSGQIPDDRVQVLIRSTPGFAEWRDKQHKAK